MLAVADQMPWEGFSVTNLLILIVILAVLWPVMRWLRRRASESRGGRGGPGGGGGRRDPRGDRPPQRPGPPPSGGERPRPAPEPPGELIPQALCRRRAASAIDPDIDGYTVKVLDSWSTVRWFCTATVSG